jgi:hypothetical protein
MLMPNIRAARKFCFGICLVRYTSPHANGPSLGLWAVASCVAEGGQLRNPVHSEIVLKILDIQ